MSGANEICHGKGGLVRKPYTRPLLARVDLAADEVLAQGCKMLTSGNAPGLTLNCIQNKCGKAGS